MITPRFSCGQTDESVIVSVYCPSIRASDVEIVVDETLLTVHVNPYFLRLNFPHQLQEDDNANAQYNPSSGFLEVTLTKEIKGQDFKDLDLLSKLLAPRPSAVAPMIEVLSTDHTPDSATEDQYSTIAIKGEAEAEEVLLRKTQQMSLTLEREEILKAAENDWHLPQEVPAPPPVFNTLSQKRYGFLDMYSGYLKHVAHTENEVNELGQDAETCFVEDRRNRRLKHEDEKWDEEYYMADFVDDEYIQELLIWRHPHLTETEAIQYTEEENLAMLRLPRKEYLATPNQTHDLYLILSSLLFSYAYDSRTTQHDPTPESAWTICNLTPAITALDPPRSLGAQENHIFTDDDLLSTLIPSYRRSLAFPLYRSFILAEACCQDVAGFLAKGKRTVVRCLLEMKHILDHHEVYYIYSKIWLDDFCVWVQAYASDESLARLSKCVTEVNLEKSSLGWDLEGLESAALQSPNRQQDSDDESSEDSSGTDSS